MHVPLHPEIGAGGFSAVDGTVEFYGRINALLMSNMTVLDFGAGRGKDTCDDPVVYRRALRDLRGKVRHVVGADIDPAIGRNPSLDSAVLIGEGDGVPFASQSVDLIVCDATFEHIRDPIPVAAELDRILKPGGWLCARTPNRWGYIAIGASLVPNRYHVRALRRLQPSRQPVDVFPTAYRLNTPAQVRKYFPVERYRHCSYYYTSDPSYFGESVVAAWLARAMRHFVPTRFSELLMVFLRKRA